jgi:hypothetical protein
MALSIIRLARKIGGKAEKEDELELVVKRMNVDDWFERGRREERRVRELRILLGDGWGGGG